jgi:hypothetical protein
MQRTNVPVMAAIRPADEPGRASRRVLTCRARPGTADPARPGAQPHKSPLWTGQPATLDGTAVAQ